MSDPIIESSLSKPYIEVLIPGPQGPPGDSGAEFLVYTGSAYPARSSVSQPVVFVGNVSPGGLLLTGDAWVNTSASAPVTSVNGETGAVSLSAADVGAKASSYVPTWSEITSKPDFQTEIDAKLDTTAAPELIRDTIGTALVAGSGMTVTVNDVSNTITLASTGSGGGAVDSVNGFTGVVVLAAADVGAVPTARTVNGHALTGNVTVTKADVGLGSADNTADAAKAVLSATKFTTPRTINGLTYDGQASITLAKSDIGLSNVDNTSDAAKAVLSASKLTTARTINGVSFDGTANISISTGASFVMSGNVPGDMVVNDLVAGGISVPVTVTLDKMLFTVDIEPRGADLVIAVIKRTRTTGTETTIGTATITAATKRTTITGLATALAVDDRVMLRCTQVGSTYPGSDLEWTMSDSTGTTFPSAVAAPAAPTSGTAVVSGSADVAVAWTAPASGAYYGVDVWKDGAFLTRVLKGTNSYLDAGASAEAHSYVMRAANTDNVSTGLTANYSLSAATIGTPVPIGFGIANTSGTVVTMNATVGVSAGDTIVLMGSGTVPTGSSETWTVTDARGNTWATAVHAYDNTQGQQSWIASTRVTTNIQAGDLITCTGTTATARLVITAYSVSGIITGTRLDKTQSNVSTTATRNLTTNATTALAQTNEIAFSCFSALTTTLPVTAGTGWSIGTVQQTTQGTNDRIVVPQWRVTNATTALTGTATLNSSSQYSGAIATFKGA